MASIGGRSFVTMTMGGGSGPAGQLVAEVTRPGINGNAFLLNGSQGAEAQYETMTDVANAGALESEFRAYRALVGQRVSLVDDHGNTYSVVVMGVAKTMERAVALFSGGGGGSHALGARWTVVVVD